MATLKILASERPDRPQDPDLSDQVWDMTVRCWRQDPARRPKMKKVVATLQKWQVFLSLGYEHHHFIHFYFLQP